MLYSEVEEIFKNALISISMTTVNLEMEGHKEII